MLVRRLSASGRVTSVADALHHSPEVRAPAPPPRQVIPRDQMTIIFVATKHHVEFLQVNKARHTNPLMGPLPGTLACRDPRIAPLYK
jgi:hypothetical protein